MQMLIRLHDPADMDLIYLKLRYRKRFPGMVRKCLRSHIEGKDSVSNGGYFIEFGDRRIGSFAKHPSEPLLVNLNLRKNEDADIIGFLSEIRDFAKSDVVKNIVRAHYTRFPAELFRGAYVAGRKPEPGVDPDRFGTASEPRAEAVSANEPRNSSEKAIAETSEFSAGKPEREETPAAGGGKERMEKKPFVLKKTERKPESASEPSSPAEKSDSSVSAASEASGTETKIVSAPAVPTDSGRSRKPPIAPPSDGGADDDPFSMLESMMNH